MKEHLHEKLAKEGKETYLNPTQAEIDMLNNNLRNLRERIKKVDDKPKKEIKHNVIKNQDWRVSLILRTFEKIQRKVNGYKTVKFGKLEKIVRRNLFELHDFDAMMFFLEGAKDKYKHTKIAWKYINKKRVCDINKKYRQKPESIKRHTMTTYLRLYNDIVKDFVDISNKLKFTSGKTGCKYHFNYAYVSIKDIERIYNTLKKYKKDGNIPERIKIGVRGEVV